MTLLSELEFLLVSNDYATLTAVFGGVKKFGARFTVVPTADSARDYIDRRKIDGVFVDRDVPGALDLIHVIRKGYSNSKAVIYGCLSSAEQSTATLNAGANFLLRKPLNADGVAVHLTIAKDILLRERRRYFRHPVNFPVSLVDAQGEQHAKITNLSEGGMAVRTARPLKHASVIDFWFEFPLGVVLKGKGQVAWTNSEGMAGIFFQSFHADARAHLEAWVEARAKLDLGEVKESG
jgi:hypothetical protein